MYPQQLVSTEDRVAEGEIVDVEEAYGRQIQVPWRILLPVLILAGVGRLPVIILATLRRTGIDFGGRGIKALRAGPEIPVMPLWVRDADGRVVEMEVHGYVRSDRLMCRDRVRAQLRPQRRADFPPRAQRIENFTTGQVIEPHPATAWSHIGLSIILQAVIGGAILVFLVVASLLT